MWDRLPACLPPMPPRSPPTDSLVSPLSLSAAAHPTQASSSSPTFDAKKPRLQASPTPSSFQTTLASPIRGQSIPPPPKASPISTPFSSVSPSPILSPRPPNASPVLKLPHHNQNRNYSEVRSQNENPCENITPICQDYWRRYSGVRIQHSEGFMPALRQEEIRNSDFLLSNHELRTPSN